MTNGREERIRRRAHEIWEQEGRPEGRHDEHWQRAMQEVDGGPEAARTGSMRGSSSDSTEPAPTKGRRRAAAGDAAPKPRAPRGAKASGGPREVTSEGTEPDGAPPGRRRSKVEGAGASSGTDSGEGGGRVTAEPGKDASSKGRARRTAKASSAE